MYISMHTYMCMYTCLRLLPVSHAARALLPVLGLEPVCGVRVLCLPVLGLEPVQIATSTQYKFNKARMSQRQIWTHVSARPCQFVHMLCSCKRGQLLHICARCDAADLAASILLPPEEYPLRCLFVVAMVMYTDSETNKV